MNIFIVIIQALWMFAFLFCTFDFGIGLVFGVVRPTGLFIGLALVCWLIAWLDGRPSKGCR